MHPVDILTQLLELRYLDRDNWAKVFAALLKSKGFFYSFLNTNEQNVN